MQEPNTARLSDPRTSSVIFDPFLCLKGLGVGSRSIFSYLIDKYVISLAALWGRQ